MLLLADVILNCSRVAFSCSWRSGRCKDVARFCCCLEGDDTWRGVLVALTHGERRQSPNVSNDRLDSIDCLESPLATTATIIAAAAVAIEGYEPLAVRCR